MPAGAASIKERERAGVRIRLGRRLTARARLRL
jgi:hypothetical protein